MKQILNVTNKNYDILISNDNFSNLIEELNCFTKNKKKFYIVSKKVYKLYSQILNLPKDNIYILPDGEHQKNYKNYIKILTEVQKAGLTRHDIIIAIGGGVVGDISGFVASTYMRGIDYVQIPTTLLSMVDSSVGGKTAIDFNCAKNMIGTFYQPKRVFININFLNTLDKKQYLSGIGEVLKYAFIENNCGYKHSLFLFEYLTLCAEKLLEKEPITLMRIIEYCLNLKIAVVEQDEKETNLRKILNLGHTFGHALETIGKYKKYTHGDAVVKGIFFIFNYAYAQGLISYSYYRLSIELLSKYGFKNYNENFSKSKILTIMQKDKKATSEKITFIVPCDKKEVKEIQLLPEEVLTLF